MAIFSIAFLLFYTNLQDASSQSNQPLLLTPLLRERKIQEAQSLSQVKLSQFPSLRSYSGYFTVDQKFNSNLFFWFFQSQSNYIKDPIIVSLEGGPGISSLVTLFYENGPLKLHNSKQLFEFRNVSWNNNNSIIYIDNPVGSGFSYFTKEGGTSRNISIIADYVYEALIQFFQLFPELRSNDFYVAGLSYGAKYALAVSTKIHKINLSTSRKVNLRGVALGSGVLDPIRQFNLGKYLYQYGLVDENGQNLLNHFNDIFSNSIRIKNYVQAFNICNDGFFGLYNVTSLFTKVTGYNFYYNLIYASIPSFYRFAELQDPIDKHLRRYINVGNTPFLAINLLNTIMEMNGDFMKTVEPMISKLLDHYPIIIFNGQFDVIGVYPQLVTVIENLTFIGQEDYKTAPRKIWYVDNDVAGYMKQAGNLTEVLIRNAGHFTTTDQPVWTERLINCFTRNKQLAC